MDGPPPDVSPQPSPTRHHTVTFIVRVWAEYLDARPPRWCGVIEPVGGGRPLYFAQPGEIETIIRIQTQSQILPEDNACNPKP